MMILTSHQPDFLPYMGFFYKVLHSDALVISDDVQFSKKGMHNWNYIKTPEGAKKLTIPVHAHHDTPLRFVEISECHYSLLSVAKTLEQNYRKAPHFSEGMEIVEIIRTFANLNFKKDDTVPLAVLNNHLNGTIMQRFGILPKRVKFASALGVTGHKDERIFQMCEALKADTYLSGRGAASYHDPEEYKKRGIRLIYTDYEPVQYGQLHGEFAPNLSVIDYIFNCGFELPQSWRRDAWRT